MVRFKSDRIEPKGETLEQELSALMNWINRDTRHSSRIKDSKEHPGFAEIVGYGQEIIPFILKREMNWVEMELVSVIFDSRPEIPENERGRLDAMRRRYIEWLRDNYPEFLRE